MTIGNGHASDDLEHRSGNVLASVADVSLRFALAQTEIEFRDALEGAATCLAETAAGPVSTGEIGFSAAGKAKLLWRSRCGGLAVDDDNLFDDWHARTTRRGGDLTPAKSGSWQGLLSGGAFSGDTGLRIAVFFHDGILPPECVAQGGAVANAAAVANVRIRTAMTAALERRRIEILFGAARSSLEIDADVLWEAGEDGIVRVHRVMNGRKDMASLIDGIGIDSVRTAEDGPSLAEVLRERRNVRRLRVEFDNCPLGRLYVSAGIRVDDLGSSRIIGILAEGEDGDTRRRSRETAAMMVQMRSARRREERQRREAEAMLQGLRLLLAQDSTREKMEHLVSLVCECIGASGACVVQRGLDGTVRFLMPRHGTPGKGAEAALDLVAAGERDGAALSYDGETEAGRRLRNAFDLDGRYFAALPLPLRGDDAFLICTSRRAEGFLPEDIDFAGRLTLLLRQALFLREEQSQLAQTAKMAALGQMSASIAHELRQPLNTISLAVQNLEVLLEAPEVDGAAVATKTKRVLAQVERASEVIDRMRRFGRKSAGEQATVPLGELVENVEAIMHHVLLRAGVCLETDVPDSLAAIGDPLQFEQVLCNLIQNAVDAISGVGAKHERDEGTIRIYAAPSPNENDMISLRVEDNGPGFRQETMDRALEPFFTTKTAEHGTGLGLAICDTIIRESGGRIELGNHAGGGCIALILPRAAG
ncbi:MAG: ATP-binding protein [Parvibaculum sp.]|uniref:sensor histidine kinase n=1 Tax=Parvibaculum sp. TaxID=2024848 RepID=UPI002ABC96B8|nr:ATP-binding protein [Parvibaculum sp.]MDZ4380998.1 ATP-binding protein [Parvibaculum sp.]